MGKVYKILFFAITLLIIINFSVNSFLKPVNVKYDGINQELSLQNDVEVLFDDYGHDGFEDTREIFENFFKDKKIQFLQLMTGQALIVKK